MKSVSSAFWEKLQQPFVPITELIELRSKSGNHYWTTNNANVVASGQTWKPFPGSNKSGIESSNDLAVKVVDFVLINSGGVFDELLLNNDLDMAEVVVTRVFTDTPGLGSMFEFKGKIGDYSYDRNVVQGQARNTWRSANIQWPYYTYLDTCAWRFGSTGCGIDTSSLTFVTSGISSIVSQNAIVASPSVITQSYQNGQLEGGRFKFLTGPNSGVARMIRINTGDVLHFSHSFPYTIGATDVWEAFPGCRKRLIADCTSRYDNSSHFMGFPFIPRQDQAF